MRQKRVLDAAAENPDASMQELAEMVPSTTTDLVERTLETYGDPAEESEESEPVAGDKPPEATCPESSAGQTSVAAGQASGATGQANETARQATDGGVTEHSKNGDTVGDTPTPGERTDGQPRAEDEEMTDPEPQPSPEELTAKQREIFRAIAERPEATQRDLAAELGVSASTVSNHVNRVAGFEWDQRQLFVEAVFDGVPSGDSEKAAEPTADAPTADAPTADAPTTDEPTADAPTADAPTADAPTAEWAGVQSDMEELAERISALERHVRPRETGSVPAFEDPALAHKVIHACMNAETISREEELQILRAILDDT